MGGTTFQKMILSWRQMPFRAKIASGFSSPNFFFPFSCEISLMLDHIFVFHIVSFIYLSGRELQGIMDWETWKPIHQMSLGPEEAGRQIHCLMLSPLFSLLWLSSSRSGLDQRLSRRGKSIPEISSYLLH